MTENPHHGRSRIREALQIVGFLVGALTTYSMKDWLGLDQPVTKYGFAILGGIAGVLAFGSLYSLIFRPAPVADPTGKKGDPKSAEEGQEGHLKIIRETVESVVIALVLAFLFRAFEAEAFVIPTGSMAPTLMGRHKDVYCRNTGANYRAGASTENEDNGRERGLVLATHDPFYRSPTRIEQTFDQRFGKWRAVDRDLRSFSGDRIIVSKFVYEFSEPKRWDVIVFKYPGNPKQNYIKRLVGLPGERIRIRHGDILCVEELCTADARFAAELDAGELTNDLRSLLGKHGVQLSAQVEVKRSPREVLARPVPTAEWRIRDLLSDEAYYVRQWDDREQLQVLAVCIARKSPRKLMAMLQRVDDTAHVAQLLVDNNWPTRWQPWARPGDSGDSPWQVLDGGRRFKVTAGDGDSDQQPVAWLRYHHLVPNLIDWRKMQGDPPSLQDEQFWSWMETQPPTDRPGQLIPDYYAYNDVFYQLLSDLDPYQVDPNRIPVEPRPHLNGLHWVGDLAMDAEVTVEKSAGLLWLQLIEGGHFYHCRINLADGKATLSIDDGEIPFTVGGADRGARQLTATTKLKKPGKYRLRFANCDDELVLWVNGWVQKLRASEEGPVVRATYANDPDCRPFYSPDEPGDLMPVGIGSQDATFQVPRLRVLRDIYYIADTVSGPLDTLKDYPSYVDDADIQIIFQRPQDWAATDLFEMRGTEEFNLLADQFFPLGDNSPASKDGRLWDAHERYVDRRYLTGKALFIYWPHSWDRPVPFFPNFRRMGFVR